jgi:hypothetical protein
MNKKVFNNNDYNSDNGMLTSIWGPPMWHTLHTISFNYPVNPTLEQKKDYLNFFRSLQHILPCKYCRDNYKKNIKKLRLNLNTMKNRESLSLWLFNLHEEINKNLGKKSGLSYKQVRDRYEAFRSRCLKTKPTKKIKKTKKEKGCVTPVYGVKSKCVLNIVPRTKKCKSLKISKKCLLKK